MASQFPEDRPPTVAPPPYPPTPAGGGVGGRIQRILLQPRDEWARIDAEPATAAQVFRNWAVPLAAIGPVAGLIGQQLFGYSFFGVHYRPSLGSSIATALLGYLASLAGVWVITLIIDALAPNFGAVRSRDQAMKVAAYSYTAAWVASVLQIIPMLGAVAALLGLYSFYLLWLGLPRLMRAPADKATGYVAATVVVAVVVYLIIGAVVGAVAASVVHPAFDTGAVTISGTDGQGNGGSVDLGKLAAAGQQMAAAAEKNAATVNAAAASAPAANAPNGRIADPAALQALLPAAIAGFTRTAVESSGGGAGGIGGANAKGTYTQGDQTFELSVSDVGALGGLATLGGALNVHSSKETATGYEKTSMQNGNMVDEEWDNADHHGKYSTMVASRFAVAAEGSAPSIDPLKAAVGSIDMGKLAAMAK